MVFWLLVLTSIIIVLYFLVVRRSKKATSAKLFYYDPTTKGYIEMSNIIARDSDPALKASVTFTDAKGSATTPDSTPLWASSDSTVANVSASDDGLSASVTLGVVGVATVSVTVTQNDGSKLVASGQVDVTPGEATQAELVFTPGEAPVPAPEPVPAPAPEPAPEPAPVEEPAPAEPPAEPPVV